MAASKNYWGTIMMPIIAILLVVWSCARQSDIQGCPEFAKSDNFRDTVNVANIDSLELPMEALIKTISLQDSTLLMGTDECDWYAYIFNLGKGILVDSLAKRGQGVDEFVSATVTMVGEDSLLVVDNSQMLWSLFRNGIKTQSDRTNGGVMNSINAVSFPLISYIDYKPECSKLMLLDLSTNTVNDSIIVPNIILGGSEVNSDFTQDYNRDNNIIALAFFDENKIMIGSIDGNKFNGVSIHRGAALHNTVHYTDIKVASDCILALSQKNINAELMTGYSAIEVFDLDCNPISFLRLPSIYINFDYDEASGIVILQSALSDTLYLVNIRGAFKGIDDDVIQP